MKNIVVEQPLKALGKLKTVWDKNWAKTGKQEQRYVHYQGDEMHFFFGKIKELKQQVQQEDSWQGEKLIPLQKAVEVIESTIDKSEYRRKQLQCLKEIERREELDISH